MPFVQAANNSSSLAASVSVGSGQSWAAPTAGNLLVAYMRITASNNSPDPANFSISGWTAIDAGATQSSSFKSRAFYKVAAGTETTVTGTWGVNATGVMVVGEFSGVATTSTLDTHTTPVTGTSVTSLALGSLTPASDAVFLLAVVMTNLNPTPYDSPIFPGYTDSSYAAGSNFKSGELVTGGTGGSTTYNATAGWSGGTARNAIGQLIAFRRPPAPITPTTAIAATSGVAASVAAIRELAGSSAATSQISSAALTGFRPVAGASAATSGVVASVVRQRPIPGGSVSASSAIGLVAFGGQVRQVTVTAITATSTIGVGGTRMFVNATSNITASVSRAHTFPVGAIQSTSAVSAFLQQFGRITATINATSAVVAALHGTRPLSAGLTASSNVVALLGAIVPGSGTHLGLLDVIEPAAYLTAVTLLTHDTGAVERTVILAPAFVLLESGDRILMENGTARLLLESSNPVDVPGDPQLRAVEPALSTSATQYYS